jgi:hypothetical protein
MAAEGVLSTNLASEVGRAQGAEAAKAPNASPAFSGTPTAPTPSSADNTTKIATTAFVKAQGYLASGASFSNIGAGTNANALLVSGSLAPTGGGTITASSAATATNLAATTQCVPGTNGLATGISVSGAAQCSTNGAALTTLNASNLSTGTIPGSRIAPTRTSASNTINTASSGTTLSVTVACPSGVLLSGGGQATSTSTMAALAESYPSSATQWIATAVYTGSGNGKNLSVTAWVVCEP